jgi:hypothetical protein
MGPPAFHVAYVSTVKQTFDLAQAKNKMDFNLLNLPEGYLKALLLIVVGNDEEKRKARELLASVDPDHWKE